MVDVATLAVNVNTTDLKAGKADLDAFTAAGVRAETQTRKVGRTSTRMGAALKQNSNVIRQTSLQFSQLAQQATAGGGFLRALAIQLPDLGLAFGTVGIAAGIAGGVLLNFGLSMLGTGKDAKTLEDQMDALATAMTGLDRATDNATQKVTDLFAEYGLFAKVAQDVLNVQREIAQLDALRALSDTIGQITTTFGSFRQVVDDTGQIIRDDYIDTITNLQGEFGIARDQAFALANALRKVGTAERPEAQLFAIRAAREQLELAAGSLADMDEKTREVYDGLLDAELAASQLAAIDVAANIGAGADEAERLAGNLIDAFNAKSRLDSGFSSGGSVAGGRGSVVPDATDGILAGLGGEFIEGKETKKRGGGGKTADLFVSDLEKLQAELATEQQVLDEWYFENLELLESRRAAELLGEQTQKDLLLSLEQEYQERMTDIQKAGYDDRASAFSGALGDLAVLMASENKKLFKIGQAAAIAEAVVSGYGAAVAAWEKGMKIGGPPLAAAFTAASLVKTGALISSLRSASPSGGSSGGSGGGVSAAPVATAAPEETRRSQQVAIQLVGGDMFNRSQIVGMINAINDAVDDGAEVRLV